jgi:hypothetical protein
MSKNYPVGYKKPPLHSRFKKGRSGNPGGRPRRRITPLQIDFELDKVLTSRVAVTERGSVRQMTLLRAIMTQMAHKAVKGHHPTTSLLLSHLAKRTAVEEAEPGSVSPGEDFAKEIDAILKEIGENLSERPGSPDGTEPRPSETEQDPDPDDKKES